MIELINNKTVIIQVQDLGIELQPNERINLENIDERFIINSQDLINTQLTFQKDGVDISYNKAIQHIRKLRHPEHIAEDTIAHNLRDDYYFTVEKVGDITSKIIYFRDAAKTQKIREEEIVRNSGLVSQIILKVYDDNGIVVETETQDINRVDSRVNSIVANIGE